MFGLEPDYVSVTNFATAVATMSSSTTLLESASGLYRCSFPGLELKSSASIYRGVVGLQAARTNRGYSIDGMT